MRPARANSWRIDRSFDYQEDVTGRFRIVKHPVSSSKGNAMSVRFLLTLTDDAGIGECTEYDSVDLAVAIETTQHGM
jgi:hypothetical protein